MSDEYTQDDLEQDTEFARYRWEAQTGETKSFDRWLAGVERAAAVRALEEFAQAQDSWCEQGRAEQVISRAAMREALRARAAEIREKGES